MLFSFMISQLALKKHSQCLNMHYKHTVITWNIAIICDIVTQALMTTDMKCMLAYTDYPLGNFTTNKTSKYHKLVT